MKKPLSHGRSQKGYSEPPQGTVQRKVKRMDKLPSDSGIYIKKLEETLLSCFEQWREVTAALVGSPGKREWDKVRDLDCIDWFCSDMKARLTELKKRGGHPGLWRFG